MRQTIILVISLLVCSGQISAGEPKINIELTAYLPGIGIEYQWDESKTVGLNYAAVLENINISLTSYDKAALSGGYYTNIFLGYDNNNNIGLGTGDFVYLGGVFGRQWLWDNGININADAGLLGIYFPTSGEMLPSPAFAISLGYIFSLTP